MKSKTCFFLLLLVSKQVSGQLQVDAGNDTILCISPWDTLEIGGRPTAWGGQEPYTYVWSANVPSGSHFLGASLFLDDTTKANPKLVDSFYDDLEFKLEVRDNTGAVSVDSIKVGFSRYYSLAIDFYAIINQGDTVILSHDILNGIPPLRYAWSPNYNISDTSVSSPSAWPDTNTSYEVIVIDSIGCVSWPCPFRVYVRPSGIPQYTGYQSTLFPNPIDNSSVIYFDVPSNNNLVLKILDSNGKVILTDKFLSDSYYIGEKILKSGVYFYVIYDDAIILTSGKFIKN